MKPAQENLQFKDLTQTLRSAEARRADDLGRWLRLLVENQREPEQGVSVHRGQRLGPSGGERE